MIFSKYIFVISFGSTLNINNTIKIFEKMFDIFGFKKLLKLYPTGTRVLLYYRKSFFKIMFTSKKKKKNGMIYLVDIY
jgi:hypothetical protein